MPLIKSDAQWTLPTFEPLYLQAAKLSEDKSMTVVRLGEQNGNRGTITLDKPVYILDMLENKIEKTDRIDYTPFEIITVGVLNNE